MTQPWRPKANRDAVLAVSTPFVAYITCGLRSSDAPQKLITLITRQTSHHIQVEENVNMKRDI